MRSRTARRILLGTTALAFVAIALASLIAPDFMARGVGYHLDNVDARSEFRAVYVGVWLATAGLLVVALLRVDEPLLGDLGAMFVLAQAGGRVLSLLLDGPPSDRVWPMFALEALGGLALLLVRPEARGGGVSGES